MAYERGYTPEVLDQSLKVIRKYINIIDLDEFMDIIHGRKRLEANAALITFDDADGDFMEYALPVITDHGIKVVIFVPTGFIETGKLFWHVRVSNIIENLDMESWQRLIESRSQLPNNIREILGQFGDFDSDIKGLLCRNLILGLNKMPDNEINGIVSQLESITGCPDTIEIRCMNWKELKKLREAGHYLESHSVTHRKLAGLDEAEIKRELADARRDIEVKIGTDVRGICYPAGSFDERVVEIGGQTGYKAGFTTKSGICRYPLYENDVFRIPRLDICNEREYVMHKILGLAVLREIFQ